MRLTWGGAPYPEATKSCANFILMKSQTFEHALMQAMVFEIAVAIALIILLFWATYCVIKAGVRDGIRESGLRHQSTQRPSAPPGYKWALVRNTAVVEDMHAD